MSAPLLWIGIPFGAGLVILFFFRERYSAWIGGTVSGILAFIALSLPIDTALLLGSVSVKISPSIEFFGRSFEFSIADGPLLAIIYGMATVWFFGTEASGGAHRFVSLGLMIVALLTASISVEPFLFAALLIEIAAMLVIPLLVPEYQAPRRGVVRFLIYQTLAMPFILFSGWMLAGVEASPGDIGSTTQAGVMLGLGFAFLMAVFPLNIWIPMLMEEASPYAAGFLLWALPMFTVILALGFLDRFAWLRATPQLTGSIQLAGVLMVVSGGVFASLQRHIGRILGYASITEMGLLILVMGMNSLEIVDLAFMLLIPHGLALAVGALALSTIKKDAYSLLFNDIRGFARSHPVAAATFIFAQLSMTGFPLLAGFPVHLAIWQKLSRLSLASAIWVFIGMLGLMVASLRSMAVFVMADDDVPWAWRETWTQAILLGLGGIGLFILGIFPQFIQPVLQNLPALFERLGQ